MYIEPINISQKNTAPGTQKRLPADKGINLQAANAAKPDKVPDSSHVKALVADIKNNLHNLWNNINPFCITEISYETYLSIV